MGKQAVAQATRASRIPAKPSRLPQSPYQAPQAPKGTRIPPRSALQTPKTPRMAQEQSTATPSTASKSPISPRVFTPPSKQPQLTPPTSPRRPASSPSPIAHQSATPRNPHFEGPAHLGQPCTLLALDHQLTCGHKIFTTTPEPCASNCHTPSADHALTLANPRALDSPFRCLACVTGEAERLYRTRVSGLRSELGVVAKVGGRGRKGEGWAEGKVAVLSELWRETGRREVATKVDTGRQCVAGWVEESWLERDDGLGAKKPTALKRLSLVERLEGGGRGSEPSVGPSKGGEGTSDEVAAGSVQKGVVA